MTDMVLVPRQPTREMIEAGEAERRAHPTNVNPWLVWTAMLSAAPPASVGWQPIETAPRDGTPILVTDGQRVAAATPFDYDEPKVIGYEATARPNPKFGEPTKLLWSSIGRSAWSHDTETNDYDGPLYIMRPTNWMPFPTPPEREG